MYKGTIIENSLSDVAILTKVRILATRYAGDWILHDVLIEESCIPELSQCLAIGPWYVHLWKPGNDTVKIVYRDAVFDIVFSDKSTWRDAVAYGKSIGIPDAQLDFPID